MSIFTGFSKRPAFPFQDILLIHAKTKDISLPYVQMGCFWLSEPPAVKVGRPDIQNVLAQAKPTYSDQIKLFYSVPCIGKKLPLFLAFYSSFKNLTSYRSPFRSNLS